jgi:hypothetical protein
MRWLIVTYRLPSRNQSRERVAVWREVRRSGALQLQQSVVAFPDTGAFRQGVERLRALVGDLGGQALVVRADPLAEADGRRLTEAWEEARSAEYGELTAECGKFLAEIDREFAKEKFTLAELEEEEAELDKLQRWHARIRERDVLGSAAGADAEEALRRAAEALERFSTAVFERTGS